MQFGSDVREIGKCLLCEYNLRSEAIKAITACVLLFSLHENKHFLTLHSIMKQTYAFLLSVLNHKDKY